MPIEIPGLELLHRRLLADFAIRFPDGDWARTSDNWKRLRVLAGASLLLLYHQKISIDDLFPDTAEGTALERIGVIWGVIRKAATPARKTDALRVFGTAASTVSIGDQLTSASGLVFQVNEDDTVPAAGYIDVDVVGVSVGSATKLQAGDKLTFSSPPAGIDATAELQLDMDEDGEDAELDGDYRVRILDRIGQPGMGGNANDYRAWALEVTGISSAYVYPNRRGYGSLDLAALHTGSGSVRILTAAEETALFDYIDDASRRPVSMKLFRVVSVTEQTVNVDMTIEVAPTGNYSWDWDDTTPPTVDSWTAATRVLNLSSRPSDMAKGDRITIKTVAGNGAGEQLEIEALGPAADEVTLKAAPTVAPVSGDTVYSGGDAVDLVRDAVLAYIDSLGPEIGTTGTGEWEDSVRIGRLQGIGFGVGNIRSLTVVAPVADVTPAVSAFPADTSVELLTPGEVIVRTKH